LHRWPPSSAAGTVKLRSIIQFSRRTGCLQWSAACNLAEPLGGDLTDIVHPTSKQCMGDCLVRCWGSPYQTPYSSKFPGCVFVLSCVSQTSYGTWHSRFCVARSRKYKAQLCNPTSHLQLYIAPYTKDRGGAPISRALCGGNVPPTRNRNAGNMGFPLQATQNTGQIRPLLLQSLTIYAMESHHA